MTERDMVIDAIETIGKVSTRISAMLGLKHTPYGSTYTATVTDLEFARGRLQWVLERLDMEE